MDNSSQSQRRNRVRRSQTGPDFVLKRPAKKSAKYTSAKVTRPLNESWEKQDIQEHEPDRKEQEQHEFSEISSASFVEQLSGHFTRATYHAASRSNKPVSQKSPQKSPYEKLAARETRPANLSFHPTSGSSEPASQESPYEKLDAQPVNLSFYGPSEPDELASQESPYEKPADQEAQPVNLSFYGPSEPEKPASQESPYEKQPVNLSFVRPEGTVEISAQPAREMRRDMAVSSKTGRRKEKKPAPIRTRRRVQIASRMGRWTHSPFARALLILLAIGLILFTGVMGVAFAYYQAQLPMLNKIASHTAFQTTRIYDRNGQLLYEINDPHYGRRTYVNYNDISKNLIDATVAAEDHTFWSNNGVDFQGILRAGLANMTTHKVIEGASTITQQLIKRQFFANQPRNIKIKLQEAVLAAGITQQIPKWKILEMYLNVIYYGELNYGAEAAAQDFFGLHPKCILNQCIPAVGQLDLAQASMLAGLPQLPSYYDPITNKQAALARQKLVLDNMVDMHTITELQARQARQEMEKFNFKAYTDPNQIQAPHFVHYVVDQVLAPMFGAQNLYSGGYNIYTTLDLNLEKKVEQLTYYHLYKEECSQYLGCQGAPYKTFNLNNAAAVVMNPVNGEILAMNGSVNYKDNNPVVRGQFNSAVDALRQPGSSIKPVIYATAFEMGWYPAMVIPDHQTIYPTPDSTSKSGYYMPENYDQQFHSGFPMTVRNAIANSYNIPAVDTIEYVGINNVLNMAGRLGLTSIANQKPDKLGPSLALGAKEVSLLNLTGAYATFANQGVRAPQVSVLRITDNQGHQIYSFDESHPHGVRAISPEVAFLMSSILSDKAARYHEFGPGNPLELDFPAAAKTGTTNSFVDNWTMGYTPHLAVGVWAGNSDNTPMSEGVIGITGAGPIWHDIMDYATKLYHFPASNFVKPDNVVQQSVSAQTGLQAQPGEPTVTDWFIKGTTPTIHGTYSAPPPCSGPNCPAQPNQGNGQPGTGTNNNDANNNNSGAVGSGNGNDQSTGNNPGNGTNSGNGSNPGNEFGPGNGNGYPSGGNGYNQGGNGYGTNNGNGYPGNGYGPGYNGNPGYTP